MSTGMYIGLAGRDATVLVVGYAVLYCVGLARNHAAIKLAGLAFIVGYGVLGVVVAYLLMIGASFGVGTVLAAAGVLVVVCIAAAPLVPSVPAVTYSPQLRDPVRRTAVIVGAAVIVFAAAAALVVAIRSPWPPDADTIGLWVPHAGVIYREGLGLGSSGWGAFVHPEYPPLFSTMYAISFAFVGGFHPAVLAHDQCLLGLAFVGAVLALLDRCVPRWLAVPSMALLIVAPEFFTRLESLLPDQTLAYFVATAGLACVLWLREQRAAWLVLAVILSTAGTLTKSEGVTYAFLLAAIVVAGLALRRRFRSALIALALFLGVVAIEPWRIWLGHRGFPTSSIDYNLTSVFHPLYMAHRSGRAHYAAHQMLADMFSPSRWLVIAPLTLFALLAAVRRSPLLFAATAGWLLLAFLGLVYVYWVGNFHGFTLQNEVYTSAVRVSGTIVIVAGVMVPLVLGLSADRWSRAPEVPKLLARRGLRPPGCRCPRRCGSDGTRTRDLRRDRQTETRGVIRQEPGRGAR